MGPLDVGRCGGAVGLKRQRRNRERRENGEKALSQNRLPWYHTGRSHFMKSLLNSLVHANAKAFAIFCAVLFVGMLGWGAYTEYDARCQEALAKEAAERRSKAPLPTFSETQPLGLLAYVESQTATGTEDAHLPVDLFRCPVDASGNVVRTTTNTVVATPAPVEDVPQDVADLIQIAEDNGNTFGWTRTPGPGGTFVQGPARPQPIRNHELVYNGVFKRTDGTVVAMVTDKGTKEHKFVKEGDEFGGATIIGGDVDKLRLRLEDGTECDLVRGGEPVVTGQIPPPPGQQQQPQRQRVRRLPTESEIRELEKKDPELAQRIRDAIRRHNERQEKGK